MFAAGLDASVCAQLQIVVMRGAAGGIDQRSGQMSGTTGGSVGSQKIPVSGMPQSGLSQCWCHK